MNVDDTLTRDLRVHLRASWDERVAPGQLEAVLSRTVSVQPRSEWLVRVRGGASGAGARGGIRRARWLVAVITIITLLALLAAALIAGQQRGRVGGLLAFSRFGVVYVALPDGSGALPVAQEPGFFLSVPFVAGSAWSPDGRYLAVERYPAGSSPTGADWPTNVVLFDSRTLQVRAVADGWFIGWTSSGEAVIAGLSRVSVSTFEVDERAVRLTTRAQAGVAFGPVSVSPDGRWLAAFAGRYLARIDTRTGATETLYDNVAELVDVPAWSPDSSRIAFARTQSRTCHTCMGPIMAIAADGSHLTTVSRPDRLAFQPHWSPDGEWIAYSTDITGTGVEQSSIEIARPDGSLRRTLATGWPVELAWNPDGRAVRYMTGELDDASTRYTLMEADLDGGAPRRLDDGAGVESFSWQSVQAGSSIPPLPSPIR